MKGPWALMYRHKGDHRAGIMLSASPTGWLVSGGAFGLYAGIGWAYHRPRDVPGFTRSIEYRDTTPRGSDVPS